MSALLTAAQPCAALTDLQARAVRDVTARGLVTRRPTWAPFIALGDELANILCDLGALEADEAPLARLWANFTLPKGGAVECKGFDLHAGRQRSGRLFFRSQTCSRGWLAGPRWSYRDAPLARATELGAAAVLAFAGDADAQMKLGGILAKACACCGRTLTDSISLEYGIGLECRAQIVATLGAAGGER